MGSLWIDIGIGIVLKSERIDGWLEATALLYGLEFVAIIITTFL